tara:strand:- start:326 stop:598 length:273 start_codon:yes stop_codon:yes gene_type:complete
MSSPEDVFSEEYQKMFWKMPCSTTALRNIADVVASHVVHPSGYEAIDIRVRRNTAHKSGPGYTYQGVRLRMDEAVSLWKALRTVLTFEEE